MGSSSRALEGRGSHGVIKDARSTVSQEATQLRALAGGTIITLVAMGSSLLLFVAIEIDFPFRGFTGIAPDGIRHVIELMRA